MSTYPRKQTSRGELRIHESLDDLSTDLADYISELSEAAVKERGVFAIALTGGSLMGLSGKLSKRPYTKTIDWVKWYIFWTDERIISDIDCDSNYKLTKQELLIKMPILPTHVHPISVLKSAEDAAIAYEFGIRQHVKSRLINASEADDCPKFDLVLLDLGSDGHVASLFPGHSALGVKEWVTFLRDCPEPPPERITITLPVINAASNVVVVATGSENAEAVDLAINGADVGPDSSPVPARMINPTRGKLVWFFDKPAAAKLAADEASE